MNHLSARGDFGPSLSFYSHLVKDLAYVRKRPIEGQSSVSVPSSSILGYWEPSSSYAAFRRAAAAHGRHSTPLRGSQAAHPHHQVQHGNQNHHEGKAADFLYYSDSDDEADPVDLTSDEASFRVSYNFVDCLKARELGNSIKFTTMRLSSEYATRHMLCNMMLKEHHVSIPNMNKVFCSQWLSHKQVIFGTKCNQLMVYDVNRRHLEQIPSLQSSENSVPPDTESGIHAVELNPSKTLLATGAKNSNDLAIYKLPTLDPICVGEGAHSDWIFDLTWLDDQFVTTGSRDGTLALWRITDEMVDEVSKAEIPTYQYTQPLWTKKCKSADRVRSLCYNHVNQEIAVISLNGYIHCWNALRFRQVMSKKLPHTMENVCLTVDEDAHMYAVGSKANTDLLDARTLQAIKKIPSKNNGCGIRSVSFNGNILTIGTGIGLVFFYDLRAGKFLETTMNTTRSVSLKASSKGWVSRDENFLQNFDGHFHNSKNLPAIYTHCYDNSGSRLFVAGGPLQIGMKGNYVAIFQ